MEGLDKNKSSFVQPFLFVVDQPRTPELLAYIIKIIYSLTQSRPVG